MTSREAQLTATFVTMADTLVRDFDLTDLLTTLVSSCVQLFAVDAAGILLAAPSETLRVVASSDETMRLLELLELQNDQGPCLDSYRTGVIVTEADLATTDRWPAFAPQALDAGFASIHAVPLRLRNETIGALNLFRRRPGPLPAEDLRAAQALADVATISLIQDRAAKESQLLAQQLQHALTSRVIIEQAKGILAEQGTISVAEAFELLRARARARGVTLDSLARTVTDGELSVRDFR